MKNLGLLLLSIWLLTQGLTDLFKFSLPAEKLVLDILALSSGGVLLFQQVGNKLGNIGVLLLGFWLILKGSVPLFGLSFSYSHHILAGLGVAAGIMLLVRR